MESLAIRQVGRDDLEEPLRLLAELNPEVEPDTLRQRMDDILGNHDHYELYGAYEGERLVGVCGAWVATKLWCGRYLEVDNLVVGAPYRSAGVGSRLLEAMEHLARKRDCQILVLDSYASNTASHRLYHRQGYEIKGFHFVKGLEAVLNSPERT